MSHVCVQIPEGKGPGETFDVKLPNGQVLQVKIPEGKKAGDMLQLAIPAMSPNQMQLPPNTPMEIIKWTIPEGKGAFRSLTQLLRFLSVLPSPVSSCAVWVCVWLRGVIEDNVFLTFFYSTSPSLLFVCFVVPGDKVKIELPSGVGYTVTIKEGQKAGEVIELSVPRPFLDPKFKQKQAAFMAQQVRTVELCT